MDEPQRPLGRTFAIALGLIALITPLAVHLFFPVIPAVKKALGLSDAHAQLTFSISLFGMAFATLFYGSLSDRYGRRPVLLSGLALFLFGSVVSSLATTANALVLGRLVQAIGAGCALTLVRAIARDAFRAEQLVKAIAYLTMFGTLGPMVSPFIGGVLIDTLGWRSVFGFALVAGGVITIIAYMVMRETHPPENRHKTQESFVQSYAALFRRPRFNAYVLQTGFNTGAFMVMAVAASTMMTELLRRPATEYGLYFLLFPMGFFAGNFISTRVGTRFSAETMVLTGSVLTVIAVTAQATALWLGFLVPLVFFLPGTFVTMAQGISMPYGQAAAMGEIPRLAGTAAGIGVFMQNFWAAISTQVYGLLADGTPRPMAMMALLCAVLTLFFGAIPYLLKRKAAAG
ncbi:multidrug effflux MFS transporter [Rhodoplanes sp. Z2-YC6860]|uniref:multidrug effflux MFS transporter n=1 Tax=Rhodoplanes sp. Z2-YC6860 TaxID=674703 RepID=UPI00078B3547|nr:multidrug effflux MFS transporter [Rhodoplanes sp. Z2-YC6860]AMN38625.1 Bcr/CflA subfamily drug resistance transporter [Rhodoplanes sp. Z2-YC6860]